MSPGRISVVYQLAEMRCMVRIDCRRCAHSVMLSAAIMETMFGRLERLDTAERRLSCTRCSARGARIEVLRDRGR